MASWRWLRVGMVVGALLLAAAWLGRGRVASADVAPNPLHGGLGRDAGPAGVTVMQMVSETVLIEITPLSEVEEYYGEPIQTAFVTADFLLRNPTTASVALPVGFPLYLVYRNYVRPPNEIFGIQVAQAGVRLSTTATEIEGEPWQLWNMTFAPGDTPVRVTYWFNLWTNSSYVTADIEYVLHTGAGWAGPIGQADLIVRFPYVAEENFIDQRTVPAGHQVSGYDVTWHLTNLEPTVADDLRLRVVNPLYWTDVLSARRKLESDSSAAAYFALANAYAGFVETYSPGSSLDPGRDAFYSPLLAQVAEAQYRKAIALDPGNGVYRARHMGFVRTYAGSLLPGSVSDYIETLPVASTGSPSPATATAQPTSTDRLPATATQRLVAVTATALTAVTPSSTPRVLASLTLTAPATQLAALPTVPLFTPLPIAGGADSGLASWYGWLVAVLVALIVAGLVLALRRRAR